MFLERVFETFPIMTPKTASFIYRDNKKHALPRKLQRSPKIIDPLRYECYENSETFSELKQPLLVPSQDYYKGNHVTVSAAKRSCSNNNNNSNNNNTNNNKNSNIQVKILLTKEEAAKLLAKCQDQKGTLEFNDVMNELEKLPAQRINVVSLIANPCRDMAVLATIPEEDDEDEDFSFSTC